MAPAATGYAAVVGPNNCVRASFPGSTCADRNALQVQALTCHLEAADAILGDDIVFAAVGDFGVPERQQWVLTHCYDADHDLAPTNSHEQAMLASTLFGLQT